LEGRLYGGPGHARGERDRDDVGGAIPWFELFPDLIGGAAGSELIEDDPGFGRDGAASRAGRGFAAMIALTSAA
jgi:hypothetical protein